jgi:hypothetical protein
MIVVLLVKFGLKISIITIKTNTHKTSNKICNKYLHLLRLIVVCFACPLQMVSPSVRLQQRTKMAAVYCCVWGQDRLLMASNWPPAWKRNNCCVSPPPSPSTQLIVVSPSQSPPSQSPIKLIRMCPGRIVSFLPPPEHILCWAARTPHRSIFVLLWRLFHHPHSKIDGLKGNRGEGRHRRWCWVAMAAIVRWFGGHRTWFRWSIGDGWVFLLWVVRKKVRYLVRILTKKSSWRSSLFSTAHYLM